MCRCRISPAISPQARTKLPRSWYHRKNHPRFQADNLERNQRVAEHVQQLASKKGCTPAQLVLAWVLAQGNDIIPIPGTKRRRYLEENVAAVDIVLTPGELKHLNGFFEAVAGTRYPESQMHRVNV